MLASRVDVTLNENMYVFIRLPVLLCDEGFFFEYWSSASSLLRKPNPEHTSIVSGFLF